MPLQAGTSLGPYQIDAPLGAGGMGEVYKATDTRLDRTVAIKVLPEHVANDPDLKQRFEREAKTVAALSHPHICPVFDVGKQDGINFLVMEYLDGQTLAQRLEKGALPLDQALTVAIEIADALDKAHRQGIVHRDLKPANIMLTKAGAKLLDFGLAKLKPTDQVGGLSAMATQSAGLTGEGKILGTLQYMAPEQLEGKEADARTDIFAFGATVYEMVTGQKAFTGESQASLIAAILERVPVPMSTLQSVTPARLDEIVKTCLAKDPEDRWQSARDLGRELAWIVEGGALSGESAAVVTAQLRAWRPSVGLAVVAAVGVSSLAVWSVMRPAPPAPRPLEQFVITTPPDGLVRTRGQRQVAISPDGRVIVYGSGWRAIRGDPARDGDPQLYFRAIDQLDAAPIRGSEGGEAPFFSPDGSQVGFLDGRLLRRVSVQGGPALTICDLGFTGSDQLRGASWGADDTIVFATTASEGLMRVSASGGEPTQLTTLNPDGGETGHLWPEILPNGKGVLFTAWMGSPETSHIAVVSLETGQVSDLVSDGSSPHYSPTGHILFGLDSTLWAMGFDEDRRALTTSTPVPVRERVDTKLSGAANFGLSDDGALVYLPELLGPLAPLAQDRTFVWVDRTGRENRCRSRRGRTTNSDSLRTGSRSRPR